MPAERFPCYRVRKDAAGRVTAGVEEAALDDLPPGDVLIEVVWSSLNYKDALACTGHPGVVRSFPHVPGVDAAGHVVNSQSPRLSEGEAVLVTGYGLGAERWGGYSKYLRVQSEWVVPLPPGMSLRESMIHGTAGFTAALSVEAIARHGVAADRGQVIVTGATGGVGSIAVALLAKAGYRVAAVTGKPEAAEFLRSLGARDVIGREEADDHGAKPLLSARWAAAVDTVGGNTLATLLRSTQRGGCVAACGLVGGADLRLTVYPFILRGVALLGIDSDQCPLEKRIALWNRLASDWKLPGLDRMAREVPLADLAGPVQEILAGKITGRVLVRVV